MTIIKNTSNFSTGKQGTLPLFISDFLNICDSVLLLTNSWRWKMKSEIEWNRMLAGKLYNPMKVGDDSWEKIHEAWK